FDGLLTNAFISGSGAYVNSLATGTAGTGTALTSSGRGSIVEIDNMLQTMWDAYQVSPTVLYVNSQELKNMSNKILNAGSSAYLNYMVDATAERGYSISAGGVISNYFNPFTTAADGGIKIPIKIHPNIPAGTILGYCEDLPAQYQSSEVPNIAEVKTRVDYYQMNWADTSRAKQVGVYSEQTLAVYLPQAIGVINNIANG
ncbi:MAG: hypothetical protein WCL30_02250, partial [Pseudomonadota bacterium]